MATEVTLPTEQKQLEQPKPYTPAPRPKGGRRRPQRAGRSRKAGRSRPRYQAVRLCWTARATWLGPR